MYTNGSFSYVPHPYATVLAAVSTFSGAAGFHRVSATGNTFVYARYRILSDYFHVTVESSEDQAHVKTKIVAMLAPHPLRNWFQLDKPVRDASEFSRAISDHLARTLVTEV
jgi:hypothetical protein